LREDNNAGKACKSRRCFYLQYGLKFGEKMPIYTITAYFETTFRLFGHAATGRLFPTISNGDFVGRLLQATPKYDIIGIGLRLETRGPRRIRSAG
jgi:hypothetical protein